MPLQDRSLGQQASESTFPVDKDPLGLNMPSNNASYNDKVYYIFRRHGPQLHLDEIRKLYSTRFPGDRNKCKDGAIRHNLSLNKDYIKKGDGVWTLSEETIARNNIEPTSRSRHRPDRENRKHVRRRSFAKPSGQPRQLKPRSPVAFSSKSSVSSAVTASSEIESWHPSMASTAPSAMNLDSSAMPQMKQELSGNFHMFQDYSSTFPRPSSYSTAEPWTTYGEYVDVRVNEEQYWTAPFATSAEFDNAFEYTSDMYDVDSNGNWSYRYGIEGRKLFE